MYNIRHYEIPQNVYLSADIANQKLALFGHIVDNQEVGRFTWMKICDALDTTAKGDLAQRLRRKYCA